jgi:hypothetical protein
MLVFGSQAYIESSALRGNPAVPHSGLRKAIEQRGIALQYCVNANYPVPPGCNGNWECPV